MLNWYQLKEFQYQCNAKIKLDLLIHFSTRHVFTAGVTILILVRRTIGVLALYLLMDLGALILGTMIIVVLR
jgi:hypothetical protein